MHLYVSWLTFAKAIQSSYFQVWAHQWVPHVLWDDYLMDMVSTKTGEETQRGREGGGEWRKGSREEAGGRSEGIGWKIVVRAAMAAFCVVMETGSDSEGETWRSSQAMALCSVDLGILILWGVPEIRTIFSYLRKKWGKKILVGHLSSRSLKFFIIYLPYLIKISQNYPMRSLQSKSSELYIFDHNHHSLRISLPNYAAINSWISISNSCIHFSTYS